MGGHGECGVVPGEDFCDAGSRGGRIDGVEGGGVFFRREEGGGYFFVGFG